MLLVVTPPQINKTAKTPRKRIASPGYLPMRIRLARAQERTTAIEHKKNVNAFE